MHSELSHCQGKTVTGLDFHAFCGEEWDEVVEKRFKDWALSIFGGTFLREVMIGHALILFTR